MKMKITKKAMAKRLAKEISTQVIVDMLMTKTRYELEQMMLMKGFSVTTDLCEGCGNIIKSWYDHEPNCERA
jgi:hypothetical protein